MTLRAVSGGWVKNGRAGGTGRGAFDPDSIAGLVYWIDGSDAATRTMSGDDVLTVTDKKSGEILVATGTTVDSIRMASTSLAFTNPGYLTTTGMIIPADSTVYFVSYAWGDNPTYIQLLTGALSLAVGGMRVVLNGNTSAFETYSQPGGNWILAAPSTPVFSGAFHQGTLVKDSATTDNLLVVDGVVLTKPYTLDGAQSASTALYIGSGGNAYPNYNNSYSLGELLVYSGKHTLSQRTQIQDYLKAKFGTP